MDGTEVAGWSLDSIKELTVGAEGTSCRLRLRRSMEGGETSFEVMCVHMDACSTVVCVRALSRVFTFMYLWCVCVCVCMCVCVCVCARGQR